MKIAKKLWPLLDDQHQHARKFGNQNLMVTSHRVKNPEEICSLKKFCLRFEVLLNIIVKINNQIFIDNCIPRLYSRENCLNSSPWLYPGTGGTGTRVPGTVPGTVPGY